MFKLFLFFRNVLQLYGKILLTFSNRFIICAVHLVVAFSTGLTVSDKSKCLEQIERELLGIRCHTTINERNFGCLKKIFNETNEKLTD